MEGTHPVNVTIRPATADDYDQLCEIISEVDALHRDHLSDIFRQPDGPARERDYTLGLLADENVGLFIAEAGGELVGFVQVLLRDSPSSPFVRPRRFALVDALGVCQGHRRVGIGRTLMEEAERWARVKGATAIELNVWEFNVGALAFYDKLGYKTRNRRMDKAL